MSIAHKGHVFFTAFSLIFFYFTPEWLETSLWVAWSFAVITLIGFFINAWNGDR